MKKALRPLFDVACYIIVFLVVQTLCILLLKVILRRQDIDADTMIWGSVASSAITVLLFVFFKWARLSANYLRTRPWTVLFWVTTLTLGTILPSEWLLEQLNFEMPEEYEIIFTQIISKPYGYLAIGLLVPLAEEIVFRGAILRVLLEWMGDRMHWVAIVVSALLFGVMHGNLPQFTHGFLLGLLLGWMYYRTRSIIPGLALHWVNNTVAYVCSNLMPGFTDNNLLELCGDDQRKVAMYLLFSLCMFLPSLFQLAKRMKQANNE